ncbi:cytochrome c oxidase assembly protein [Streptomyces cellulosae]|jgi:putative membrane protein/putative copper resistance protein D|uniref:Cytochrome c oxidase assembly protein n=2 Tax=Streptomyces TaxID=1883 RepID=A0ABU3J4Y4_9ACTN|nr:cytochrome c oxidase assembly protein [Streptomyces sp. McG7]MBT2902811.1 cytochrome c oxidase assembly protein [Streptomyces sp. McG8]MDQ0489617.1 putative membrane protein/putative copper resistance protein D [Streptomyces thermodiastaticus]MDT6970115.1 cytochrome c oxidase assembly protein [Streptomyces thermocarboxydus]MDX3417490.1 cytochrome c oxidase assembly protein [Streptomyces sp. MD20-1-1]MYQ31022.1 cytochrome c oxidase assembly protein [Streptomyces sp. SID4956]MYW51569.1 cytoc
MDHSGHGMTMDLPPFTLGRGLAWSADPFFLVACLLALALYGWGVVRLVRRGDQWPVGRTVAFVAGVLSIGLVMCTALNDYGMVMFSVHMVQHMVISMVSPILVLLGAPITLALRALPPAAVRGTKGPRELLLMLLHSRYMRVVTHPLFTIPMFIASLYALYFTPLFDFLMGSAVGHAAMMVHFLAVGLVFFWPIMGVDPGPHRPGHLMRMLELFAGMPFHAFFGIALMMASTPMVTTFQDPPASLGIDVLSDQSAAGGIAWAFSEVPSVLVLIALLFQWYASDQRQARRKDRAADRDGDKELEAYNAYLASLNARGN